MKDKEKELEQRAEEHLDNLIDLLKSIEMNKVTVLTGGNGKGKSLIRKLMYLIVQQKMNLSDKKAQHCVRAVSMQGRTESRPEWGAFSSALHDWPTTPTSVSTFNLMDNLLQHIEKCYLVFDEIEIGMSEEFQLAVCNYINSKLPEIREKSYGVLVITHSRLVCRCIEHDNFINIDGMTEDEWLNRNVRPLDIEATKAFSNALYRVVEKRNKNNKD